MRAVLAGAAAICLLLTSTPVANAAEWRDCGDGLECLDVPVQVDWRDPGAGTIEIALAKLPAQDQSRKLGPLLVNLGGPDESTDALRRQRDRFTELTQWFDVIAFDPRGFGDSAGVTCPTALPDPLPVMADPAGLWAEHERSGREYDRACSDTIGDLAGRLDAWQVAHDVDAIRAALGQRRLNYFGNSYGTVYGQVYADLFPHRVGRMYLDSVVDHTRPRDRAHYDPIMRQVRADLPRIDRWCAANADCALHGESVLVVWDRVLAKATEHPIPGGSGELTGEEFRTRSGALLLIEAAWPMITSAIAEADAGDASDFLGITPVLPAGLTFHAECADFPAPRYEPTAELIGELRTVEPRIGWKLPLVATRCLGLPGATYPPRPIHAPGLPPVLLANGVHDTATAPSEGRHVASQLPGARWFGVEGYHAVYLSGESRCTREIVHDYLTTGALPPRGTSCP
ncbi:alpha/beta hydrolase fold [Saccharopolyspora antimicrobica]|uniref:Alpha/beta hydrolase family protein n=1 Tax=Saccharopolyspora antimicrobica TaxID=455193 RepID=A0A1I4XQ87_9PSEU|nr:alpha/beta fold hydrolase [Saccharopolyspora antimicrobica]RKT84602.1 alpha/beta hydrolase family protein [Saccharopolyspora antimicrobica]SFN28001.1 alpha/beta hydrolase fold [Saccharopolyspora antimicrobica]